MLCGRWYGKRRNMCSDYIAIWSLGGYEYWQNYWNSGVRSIADDDVWKSCPNSLGHRRSFQQLLKDEDAVDVAAKEGSSEWHSGLDYNACNAPRRHIEKYRKHIYIYQNQQEMILTVHQRRCTQVQQYTLLEQCIYEEIYIPKRCMCYRAERRL